MWAEGRVHWITKEGVSVADRDHITWEKIPSLGFHDLPTVDKADQLVSEPSTDPTPFSTWSTDEDCQGISEEEEATQLTLEFVHMDQSSPPKNRGKQSAEVHPHRRAPKRADQSEEANRQVNYRALLALIDGRKRDDWHVLQLNESLKREGCNTITLPAFIMRADKFQKSFERSLLAGNTYRIEEFLRTAFNGDWHGSINRDSIWGQF